MAQLIGFAGTTPILRARDGAALQVGVEFQSLDHLGRVHGYVAVGIEGPGVVGDGNLFEDLMRIVLTGVSAKCQTIEQVAGAGQRITGSVDRIPGKGSFEAVRIKNIGAIPNSLNPTIERDSGIQASGWIGHHCERPSTEVIFANGSDSSSGSFLIQNAIGSESRNPLDAHADYVG